jgi:polysaccharide export outer membrane protein
MLLLVAVIGVTAAAAQNRPPAPAAAATSAAADTPPDYAIGPGDVLSIVFWREKDMSTEATVRPDGRISVPLINDVEAAGLTPEQLRVRLAAAADKFLEEPTVTVVVKEIHSRLVYITGQVPKPGPYPLLTPTTIMQLIATAGGVLEFADSENIVIMRTVNGRPMTYRFNYRDVSRRRNLGQNIELKPGDTIVVP